MFSPELLRDKRIERRYSQRQLAEMIGLKTWSVAAYEAGRVVPPTTTKYLLAKALDWPELLDDMTSGERIKIARMEKGYSSEELAELMGVTRVAVSSWENNRSCPSAEKQRKLAELLECSLSELF